MQKVTKDMSINQVLEMDRRTTPIFLSMGMHCLGCPMAVRETLEEASAVHGIDVDELVGKLNDFFEENT